LTAGIAADLLGRRLEGEVRWLFGFVSVPDAQVAVERFGYVLSALPLQQINTGMCDEKSWQ
jgi:hypothetical protein